MYAWGGECLPIYLAEGFSEFTENPREYPDLGLEGVFHDVVMQVNGYYRFGVQMPGNFKMGRAELPVEQYFENGLRVHVPDGILTYDPHIENEVTAATAVIFEQIHEWLTSLL